jgi:hypothetical protein
MHVYNFRKKNLLNKEYWLVDYDFTTKNEIRRGFYKELRRILPGKIKRHSSSKSVIEVDDFELAKAIYELALKYKAKACCLRRAITIAEYVV